MEEEKHQREEEEREEEEEEADKEWRDTLLKLITRGLNFLERSCIVHEKNREFAGRHGFGGSCAGEKENKTK